MPKTKLQVYFLHTAEDAEIDAAYQWLRGSMPSARKIGWQDIPPCGENQILWWHATGRQQIESNPHHLPSLGRFAASGGRVFLSLAAVLAAVRLGIEVEEPDICDDGHYQGRTGDLEICGLMGFLRHPIFSRTGFRGGTGSGLYLWKPATGARYWRFGYGEDKWPRGSGATREGMVWGVHRFHIGFDSRLKFAWEYAIPHVLCVGAYLYFADRANPYREHIAVFTAACLAYLGRPLPRSRCYWQKARSAVTLQNSPRPAASYLAGRENRAARSSPPFRSQRIKWTADSPTLEAPAGSNSFFDLAGERVLLMGNERGAVAEVWSHPLRLCSNLSVRMHAANLRGASRRVVWADAADARVIIRPHHIERCNAEVVERLWVSADEPLACIDWHLPNATELDIEISFVVDFRLMWPYPAGCLSEIKYTVAQQGQHVGFTDERRLFLAQFSLSCGGDEPEISAISQADHSRALVIFRRRLDARGERGGGRALQFVMIGGPVEDPQVRKLCRDFPVRLRRLYSAQAKLQSRWLEEHAEIDTPEPTFRDVARWAKLKTATFVCQVPRLGKSLLAGFATTGDGWLSSRPGYAWFFGRDACWTALAMLHYGDFDNVRELLRFLGRHQEFTGKILHELTTSGAVHYDAADSTPLYVILMACYLDHSGDWRFVRSQWRHFRNAMEFLFSTDRDGDGLIENSGVGHGWIEGGGLYGAHVEHYLAGCWAEALRAAANCAAVLGKRAEAERWLAQHQRVSKMLATEFWNEATGYFYHGKRWDGTFDGNITALAAVPLLFGYGSDEQARVCLDRLASKSFNTDWGVRLVSDEDPFYAPHGYHYGSVWPLFTGWAALAAFKRGRALTAMTQLRNSMRNYRHGALGCMEEVLHGEIYQPSGVCPHQAWSEAMILLPIFEGLLGLAPDGCRNAVTLQPHLPMAWTHFSAGPLRAGRGHFAFAMERSGCELAFSFSHQGPRVHLHFVPHFPAATQVDRLWMAGREQPLVIQRRGDEQCAPICATLRGDALHVVYRIAKCWSAMAPVADTKSGSAPRPYVDRDAERGEHSQGYLIVRESITPAGVQVVVDGDAGARHRLDFVCWGYKIKNVRGCTLASLEGGHGVIEFAFRAASTKYVRQAIEIELT